MLAEKLKAMKEDQEGKTNRNKARRPNNYKRKKKQKQTSKYTLLEALNRASQTQTLRAETQQLKTIKTKR